MTVTGPREAEAAARFLDLACLSYDGSDAPARRAEAERLLEEVPGLVTASLCAAAAVGDLTTVSGFLDADPQAAKALVNAPDGPRGWPPLLYLCYARVCPARPGWDVPATAALLLARGADPNSHTTITNCRFSALAGAMGEGEGGSEAQPPHPSAWTLANLLLEWGADPNESQGLYNTHFRADDRWLQLLLDRGLTADMRINWDATSSTRILDFVLGQAVCQGFTARVALLLEAGADADGRDHYDKRPHLANALLEGHRDIVALLEQHGAAPVTLTPQEQFRAALFADDAGEAQRLAAAHPEVLSDPGPLLAAAEHGRVAAVERALDLGLPIDGLDRRRYHEGQTALHLAARGGHLAVARLLVARGARIDVPDEVYGGTPADHAQHWADQWPTPARRETLAFLLDQVRSKGGS